MMLIAASAEHALMPPASRMTATAGFAMSAALISSASPATAQRQHATQDVFAMMDHAMKATA